MPVWWEEMSTERKILLVAAVIAAAAAIVGLFLRGNSGSSGSGVKVVHDRAGSQGSQTGGGTKQGSASGLCAAAKSTSPTTATPLSELLRNENKLEGSVKNKATTVGGEIVRNALQITLNGNNTGELGLLLGGKYRTADVTLGLTSIGGGGEPVSAIKIQLVADSTVINPTVAPEKPLIHKMLNLRCAQTLTIIISAPNQSMYNEAVVAGEVKP